jgi:acyl-CoA reductase-like NAD-dependent aldehyde dehydrogenase
MAPKVLAGIVNVNSPTVNDEIHAPMGGVRDSGWGRTGPRSLDDFSDVILINSHSSQRQYPLLIFKAAMGDIKAQALGDSK